MEFTKNDLLSFYACPEGINITGSFTNEYATILTNPALRFLTQLHLQFNDKRKKLLQNRVERQQLLDNGQLPEFLESTKVLRERDWSVAPIPPDLMDRRVEITGPTDRKMMINALNSGANVFMADMEDSNTPSWDNVIQGQLNLKDAVNKKITFEHPVSGKFYQVNDDPATLMVRPRGWHLEEWNIWFNGEPMSASLVDFGLYFFHNVKALQGQGSGPYFYLPKLENHLEARLWNEVFVFATILYKLIQR